jgi:hypothetical protein
MEVFGREDEQLLDRRRAVQRPETPFAWNSEVALAYQAVGEAPLDLVYLRGYVSRVAMIGDTPYLSRFGIKESPPSTRLGVPTNVRTCPSGGSPSPWGWTPSWRRRDTHAGPGQ